MHAHASLDSTDAVGFLSAVHYRLRRVRWFLLLGALILYAIMLIANQFIMMRFIAGLDHRFVDWGVAALIGVGFTLWITRWEDHWTADFAALEARRATAAHAVMQLEAAQATARTVAHTINQPLAVIRGVVELYRDTPSNERDDADLQTILTQVDRAADLVRQFQEISSYHTIPYAGGVPMLDLSPSPS
jgi:signal transduction histidine kinase